MKRFVLLSVLMTLMMSVWAQSTPNYFLHGQNSKNFGFYNSYAANVVAEEDGNLLLTTRTLKTTVLGAQILDDIMVRWVDENLNVIQEFVLKDSRNYELLATNMVDDVVVMLVKYREHKQLIIKRILLNKTTLQFKSEEVIYTHEVAHFDLDICWTATSENNDFTALMVLIELSKDEVENILFLLDDHMNKLWDRDPMLVDCYGLWVSNDGDIYMASANNDKVLFAKVTEEDNYQYYAEAPSAVGTLELLNVVNDCIVVGGTYTYNEKKATNWVAGYFGMSYNMNTGKLAGATFKALTSDEMAVIMNEKKVSRNRKYTNPLTVVSSAATTYGGAMALADIIHIATRFSNGVTEEYYKQGGLLTFCVDSKGEIVWRYPIRHCEKVPIPILLSQPMVADGNYVYLIQSEDKKASLEYNINKTQKNKNPITKTHDLVMYSFDENGLTGKTIVAPKQKGLLVGNSQHWFSHNYYLFYTGKKKSGLMILNAQH